MPPAKITSPRLIVSINGEHRCVAGFDGYAVLDANLAVRKLDRETPQQPDEWIDRMVMMRVGGLQDSEVVDWMQELRACGDEVAIRVAEGGSIDPPSLRRHESETDFDVVDTHFQLRSQSLAAREQDFTSRISITINGTVKCTAGLHTGALSCGVDWVRHDPRRIPDEPAPGLVVVRAGGIYKGRHVDWLEADLNVGDEVMFRLLGPGPIDEPQLR